jgi:hypothetical protein
MGFSRYGLPAAMISVNVYIYIYSMLKKASQEKKWTAESSS